MFRRAAWTLLGMLVICAPGIARESNQSWIRGVFTGKSPRAIILAETDAWQQAGLMAERTPDSFVLVGSGKSMQPLYAPGTILVMQKYPYELLERGQTVLYRNREKKVVAHVLVARARDGWRAMGLNNERHDLEPVSTANLVGVVVAAFRPLPAKRLAVVASVSFSD